MTTQTNVSSIARKHGISRQSLIKWRKEGLDLTDDRAVAERVALMPNPVALLTTAAPPADGSESHAEAKRRRAIADANLAELRSAQAAGKLIDLGTVEAAFAEIGFTLRAKLLAMPSSMTAQLEGLSGAGIHKVLKSYVHDLLTEIHESDPTEKLANHPAPETEIPASPKPSRGKRVDAPKVSPRTPKVGRKRP